MVDAENIARALLANPDLPAYEAAPQQRALQELSRSYRRLSSELKANRMSLEVPATPEVRQALQGVCDGLQRALRQLLRVMEAQVKQIAPGLLRLTGVGLVVATTVLAEVGMVSRFSSQDDYAAYSGCAPVTRASGAYQLVQVNTRGNRRLDWAMYIVVQTRLRLDERSRVYRAKKLAEGKTQREVIRCLKTYVSREIYRVMRAEQASSAPTRPSHSSKEMATSLGPCS